MKNQTDSRIIQRILWIIQEQRKLILLLSCLVVFITTYLLILPAFTLDKEEAAEQGGIDVPAVGQAADADEQADAASGEQSQKAPDNETEKAKTEKPAGESNQTKRGDASSAVILQNEENKDYSIVVEGQDDVLSEDMSVNVREIDQSTRKLKKEYDALYNDALEVVQKEEGSKNTSAFAFAKFYDISLVDGRKEVEPDSAVDVKISFSEELQKELEVKDPDRVYIVHFAVDKETGEAAPEVLKTDNTNITVEDNKITEAAFTAESFSVYAVVYTVDFSFKETSGEFSMKGGDSISLGQLIEELGITAETATDSVMSTADFLDQVESVEFSDPELLYISLLTEDCTAADVMGQNDLHVVYPLGLTQEEVLKINHKKYKAGEWLLISLKAFDTEETLTITLKDGTVVAIDVTDAQDAIMDGDEVRTIKNPAGTTIDLFDYWIVSQELAGREGWGDLNQGEGWSDDSRGLNGSGNNKGINSSTNDSAHGHALKFSPAWEGTVYNGTKTGSGGQPWSSLNGNGKNGLNSYTGNGDPFRGIVQGTLSDGYPILADNNTIGANGESLAYLFDPSAAHSGKASYPAVNQLLYVDKAGYYTYDSRDYAAQYNAGSKTFTVTEQTSNNSEIRGFWPFGTQNFWTGMHINTQFSMPSGGQVLNPVGEYKDMQFEFSGDDDTWLYVDGVLVGDGGGIHNRTEIDVNFAAGTVTVTGKKDANHQGGYEETRYLDDIFRAAGKYQDDQWEDIPGVGGHKRFKAGTYHTFDMFYLERGGGESNLYIHYNLVSTADFTGHKSYYGADEDDRLHRDQFKFELIGLDGKYHYSGDTLVADPDGADAKAIMPDHSGASASNPGTVAEPIYDGDTSTVLSGGTTVASQTYITSATEDGNINFGSAMISQMDMNEADNGNPPAYRYIIREYVPDDAVNSDGVTWGEASVEQKAAGGFMKDEIQYDGNVFYMVAQVTSWQETNASGQTITRHGLSKKYYTDDTFTTPAEDTAFVNFNNRHIIPKGSVDFNKVKEDGEPLPGAKFGLFRDEACTIPATDMETDGRPHLTAAAGPDGKVSFEDIRRGTYYMKEIEAPGGYALDETVYKVVITDANDKTQESRITILGDETEAEVKEIINTKAGELTVAKKWLNSAGQEISGGANSVTVQLKRKYMESHSMSESHSVTVKMTVEDGGVQEGTPVTQSVDGDTVVIEWDDEWQRNFNWWLAVGDKSYEGWIGDEYVETADYTFEQISSEGRSRRLTIRNVDGDVELTTKYWVNWLHSDSNHWKNLNNPLITGSGAEIAYTAAEDEAFNNAKHTQVLGPGGWSHKWTLGGTESDHNGFDFPEKDDENQKYLYYVVELGHDGEPLELGENAIEGYVLAGYSANNSTGVSSQGQIIVYNKKEDTNSVSIDILKSDDVPDSTNFLEGAVFRLEYRPDPSRTWVSASAIGGLEIEQLDGDSCFTVPLEGITLTGLTDGQYRLEEILPPEGYIKTIDFPVTFTVSDGAITGTDGTIETVRYTPATKTANAEFIIPNTPGAALPHTGGIGTTTFYILGSILVTGCAIVLISRRRLRND